MSFLCLPPFLPLHVLSFPSLLCPDLLLSAITRVISSSDFPFKIQLKVPRDVATAI